MTIDTLIIAAWATASLGVFAYGVQEILLDGGEDDFGNKMRHRIDIPLLMATTWPLWCLVVWPAEAITWIWKKLVR